MSAHARSRTVSPGESTEIPRITRAEITRAVPAGSSLTRSGKSFLAAVEADPDAARMRDDGRRNLLAVAAVYAGHASRREGTCWPGHDRVQAETGLELWTVKRHVRWLREHGYLGTVRPGSTPATRRGQRPDQGNEAAVYCLAVPLPRQPACRQPLNAPPTSRRRKSLLREKNPGAHARRENPQCRSERPGPWRDGILGRIQLTALIAVAAAFTAAGWTPADLVYAVDHRPDGTAHWHTSHVRHPAAWARHRLSLWLGDDGTPLPPRSRQLADAARAHRAKLADRERYAPIATAAERLRASGRYATAGAPLPPAAPGPREQVLAALKARLGPSQLTRRGYLSDAAEQAAESRRLRGAEVA